MTWVKLDDRMALHRKCRKAGLDAFGFLVAVICYCNLNESDGFVPDEDLHLCFPATDMTPKRAFALAKKLEAAGLLHREDGGWRVHEYDEHQEQALRVNVQRRRDGARERKQSQRDRTRVTSTYDDEVTRPITHMSQRDTAVTDPPVTHASHTPTRASPVQTSPDQSRPEHSLRECSARAQDGGTSPRFGANDVAAVVSAELDAAGAGSYPADIPLGTHQSEAIAAASWLRGQAQRTGRPAAELCAESVRDYLRSDFARKQRDKSGSVSMTQWFREPARNAPWARSGSTARGSAPSPHADFDAAPDVDEVMASWGGTDAA